MARAAAQVVEALPAGGNQSVKHLATHNFEATSRARPAPTDGNIRLVQSSYELADLHALDLVIGGHGDNHPPRGTLESSHQGRGFAKALGETDDNEMLAALEQPLQGGGYIRPRTIQYHYELVNRIEAREPHLVLCIE